MTRRTKRLLMAVVMCLAVLANVAVATAEELWVNGVDITKATNNTVTCGTGTAVYNAAEGTLTLNGATLKEETSYITRPIIQIPGNMNLTIKLVGHNTISSFRPVGINASGNLTISGDSESSLNISMNYADATPALVAQGTVTIKAADGQQKGPTVTVRVGTDAPALLYGISANGLTVTDGSKLSASISLYNSGGQGGAILVNGGMSVNEGAEVTATSTDDIWFTSSHNGLQVNGNITVDNATVRAKGARGEKASSSGIVIGENNTIEISGNSVVEASGTTAAISGTGTLTITPPNGKVAEVKVGNNLDGTGATLFGSYRNTTTFSGQSWTDLVENQYISASITGGSTETPPGGGTEGTPEGGTGVPLPEEEIPVIIPPKTGDNTPLLFYLGALLLSGAGIILLTIYTRKHREGR